MLGNIPVPGHCRQLARHRCSCHFIVHCSGAQVLSPASCMWNMWGENDWQARWCVGPIINHKNPLNPVVDVVVAGCT